MGWVVVARHLGRGPVQILPSAMCYIPFWITGGDLELGFDLEFRALRWLHPSFSSVLFGGCSGLTRKAYQWFHPQPGPKKIPGNCRVRGP